MRKYKKIINAFGLLVMIFSCGLFTKSCFDSGSEKFEYDDIPWSGFPAQIGQKANLDIETDVESIDRLVYVEEYSGQLIVDTSNNSQQVIELELENTQRNSNWGDKITTHFGANSPIHLHFSTTLPNDENLRGKTAIFLITAKIKYPVGEGNQFENKNTSIEETEQFTFLTKSEETKLAEYEKGENQKSGVMFLSMFLGVVGFFLYIVYSNSKK